jgi:large subunit ribosomal protein L18
LFVQLIDDDAGKTLLAMHSKTAKLSGDAGERTGRQAQAYLLGMKMAKEAEGKKINDVVFDRAGYKYHGIVRALADGARDGGLRF